MILHGVQDAPVDRFQSVPGIRQGTGHDDAHGVIQIGLPHLGINVNLLDVADIDRFDRLG